MAKNRPSYWFAAKSLGLGWSLPVTWQGWAAVVIYAALLVVGIRFVSPLESRLVFIVAVTVLFVAVVAFKGEKPLRWRSGRHQ